MAQGFETGGRGLKMLKWLKAFAKALGLLLSGLTATIGLVWLLSTYTVITGISLFALVLVISLAGLTIEFYKEED